MGASELRSVRSGIPRCQFLRTSRYRIRSSIHDPQGFSVSPNGVGVQGVNNASAGNGGAGIAGFFNGKSGFGNGVFGQTSSPGGNGGFFQTTASSGNALTAVATTTTGNAIGLFAQTTCASCGAVIGQQLATTGFGAAVRGGKCKRTRGRYLWYGDRYDWVYSRTLR